MLHGSQLVTWLNGEAEPPNDVLPKLIPACMRRCNQRQRQRARSQADFSQEMFGRLDAATSKPRMQQPAGEQTVRNFEPPEIKWFKWAAVGEEESPCGNEMP